MREVDGVRNRIAIRWVDRDELVALAQFKFASYAHVRTGPALLSDTCLLNHLHKRSGAAIQDRQLPVVKFDDRIVDSRSREGRKQVLGGRDQHALLHKAGGIADPGNIAPDRFHFEVIEVSASEDDSRSGGGRLDSQTHWSTAVKTYALTVH